MAEKLKELKKDVKEKALTLAVGGRRTPVLGTKNSYCNWRQKSHEKSAHNDIWDKGSCSMPGKTWEFDIGGKLDANFLREFAKLGGRIVNGSFRIAASKFDKVKELLNRPDQDRLIVVGGDRIPGVNPNADWDKDYYCKESYCKELHYKNSKTITDSAYVNVDLTKLDKTAIIKLAEAGGIIENGAILVKKEKEASLLKELGK